MALETSVVLRTHGMSPASTWTIIPFFQDWLVLLYGLAVLALWHAPVYGWLLLVSGWARRATFLWAVLPVIVIEIFEKVTFGTTHFSAFIGHRLFGFAPHAFYFAGHGPSIDSLSQLTPGKYLGALICGSGCWSRQDFSSPRCDCALPRAALIQMKDPCLGGAFQSAVDDGLRLALRQLTPLCILMVLAVVSASAQTELIQQATAAMSRGDNDTAITILEKAIAQIQTMPTCIFTCPPPTAAKDSNSAYSMA